MEINKKEESRYWKIQKKGRNKKKMKENTVGTKMAYIECVNRMEQKHERTVKQKVKKKEARKKEIAKER